MAYALIDKKSVRYLNSTEVLVLLMQMGNSFIIGTYGNDYMVQNSGAVYIDQRADGIGLIYDLIHNTRESYM